MSELAVSDSDDASLEADTAAWRGSVIRLSAGSAGVLLSSGDWANHA
jgi:hypothetical protein